jgi:NTP pyrophosphatase (non-canonical NTP hydrolase)
MNMMMKMTHLEEKMPNSTNLLLRDYEEFVEETQRFPKESANEYLIAGLASEMGEVAGVWKRVIRGDYESDDTIITKRMLDELGDVLWYVTAIALEHGSSLEEVIGRNTAKLTQRMLNNTIKGEGDTR